MFESIVRKTFVVVVVIVIMVKTNPTLEQHRRALYRADIFFSMGIRTEPLARRFFPEDAASAKVFGRRHPDYEPPLRWHDYKIFSTATAGDVFEIRQSFGILGHVFVLDTDRQCEAQERQAQRANQQELAKIVASMGKPWFRSVPKEQLGVDYSSRGCVVEGDDKP